MKKAIFVIAVLTCFYGVVFAADSKKAPMRVVVEGEEEARMSKQTPVVIIKHAAEKRISAADLKALAGKSDLENEVMDSVISKMGDIEDEVKKQKLFNAITVLAFIMLFGAVYFTRRKK